MTIPDLILSLAVLLLTPGPTNTLMALAGAERGIQHALRLIPFELAAYLCTVLPLAIAGTTAMAAAPGLRPLVTGLAAGWVLWLAIRMWRQPVVAQTGASTVTPARVFVTTLLNPKALIIGLVLLPGAPMAPRTVIFAVLVICAASAWIYLGSVLARRSQRQDPGLSPLIRRSAAVWLALLSAALAFRAAFA